MGLTSRIVQTQMFAKTLMFVVTVSFAGASSWEMRVCGQSDNLPYSNRAVEGFENRIAEIMAAELNAELSYFWLPYSFPRFQDHHLREGDCDLVIGLAEGSSGYLTTIVYYRTGPVFVYRADSGLDIDSFDDPDLRELRIGVMGGVGTAPGSVALANRELWEGVVTYLPDEDSATPHAASIEAVARGEVDVAVAAGPVGAFFAGRQSVPLVVRPVAEQFEPPFLVLTTPVVMGVRLGDEEFRDRLNEAIARRWIDLQQVLEQYGVPHVPLPEPVVDLRGSG